MSRSLTSKYLFAVALLLVGAINLAAQQATVTGNVVSTDGVSANDDRYRIGPGDVLDIRVLNRANLSRDGVRIEGNGMFRMPLIDGEIQGACKTEGELAKEISTRYAKYYRNLQVDVFIKGYHSQQVAIIGAVNEQSRFELQRRVRLLELLTYAKGPTAKAGQAINIVHSTTPSLCRTNSDDEIAAFSTYKLSDTMVGDPKANPFLEAGDQLQHLRGGVALCAQHGGPVGRDDAPVDRAGAGVAQLALDDLGRLQAIGRVDEHHAEAAGAGRGQPAAAGILDPGPGNRGQDAAAVDRAERGLGAAVGQAAERGQAMRHDVAAGAAVDVGDEPDAAGVVFGLGRHARFHDHAFMARYSR